jgi:hypothetical protein
MKPLKGDDEKCYTKQLGVLLRLSFKMYLRL